MFELPIRVFHNEEIQQNFEAIEGQLSLFAFEDKIVPSEVEGTKAQKLAVRGPNGEILGYVPLYSA